MTYSLDQLKTINLNIYPNPSKGIFNISFVSDELDNFEIHIDLKDPTINCLDVAIITAPEKRSQKTINKLKTIAGRVLSK